MKPLKIIELTFEEYQLEFGVEALSLVNRPAIKENFYHFDEEIDVRFSTDEDKRIVVGPALIPNKKILRKQNEQLFYIFLSEDTILKTSKQFLIRGNQNNSTLEHKTELKGVSVIESWVIEDKDNDKSNMYGFDLPVGTWMLKSYIDNDEVWDKIKAGEINGYSIEGNYAADLKLSTDLLEESPTNDMVDDFTDEEMAEIMLRIRKLLEEPE